GLRAMVLSNIGAYAIRPHGPLLDPMTCAGLIPGPYDIRAYEYDSYALVTNRCPEGPYRGVGMVTAVLAHERMMDMIAARLGRDPGRRQRAGLARGGRAGPRSDQLSLDRSGRAHHFRAGGGGGGWRGSLERGRGADRYRQGGERNGLLPEPQLGRGCDFGPPR